MVHFGWLSIVLLLGAAQGAVVSALLFARTPNRVANSILGAFLLLFVARIVPYIIGFAGFYDRYPWLSFAPFGITLAVGPLLYMYVVRITTDRLPGRWWLHLVPAAVQLAYYLSVFFQPLTFKNDFNARIHRPFIDPAESLLLFVSLTAYLIAAIVRYRRYEVWLRDSTSDPLLYSVSWLRTFLILFTVTVALNSGFEAY